VRQVGVAAGWRAQLHGPQTQDVAALDAALGYRLARQDLVRSLLDPRGRLFQRLELVGDSVLDAAATAALVRHSDWRGDLRAMNQDRQRLVSDEALGRLAREGGLPGVRAFAASTHRLADRIEACIGAAWVDGGLVVAERVAQRLVLDPGLAGRSLTDPGPAAGPATAYLAAVRDLGQDPEPVQQWLHLAARGGPVLRRLAVVGDAVIETAAATALYVAYPEADEGRLSGLRRSVVTNRVMAAAALRLGLDGAGPVGRSTGTDRVADRLQALVGAVMLGAGLPAATRAAATAMQLQYSPGPVLDPPAPDLVGPGG
jgi:dsRNA-specific ribonuclease